MRKVNENMKSAFDRACVNVKFNPPQSKPRVYFSGGNRTVQIVERQDGKRFVEVSFWGNIVVIYDPRDNSTTFRVCGHGDSPVTRELLNTLGASFRQVKFALYFGDRKSTGVETLKPCI